MNGKSYFNMLARYHRWASRRLYERVSELDDDAYFAERGLFFRSVHGTINHILLVDRVWLMRLEDKVTGKLNLAEEVESSRGELERAVFAQCDAIIAHVGAIAETSIDEPVSYVSSVGQPYTSPRSALLAHLFNHATHHRGQVSTALTQAGIEAPVMDIPYFLAEMR